MQNPARMDAWHYEESGKQVGPVSEEKIRQLLASNTIYASTLVWREGMPQWSRVDSISGFEISPYASPVFDTSSEIDWSGYTPTGPQVRPWIRYWARSSDFFLFSLISGFILGVVAPHVLEMNQVVFGIALLFVYNLVEPAFLSIWGYTPSKALFLIRIRNENGGKLTYRQALIRTLKIWARGEALGIPLVSIFTHLSSYSRLMERKITTWDAEEKLVVAHQEIAWWRWLILLGLGALFCWLVAIGQELTT
jgi:uncharacterized RDD family membrane protein YckC